MKHRGVKIEKNLSLKMRERFLRVPGYSETTVGEVVQGVSSPKFEFIPEEAKSIIQQKASVE